MKTPAPTVGQYIGRTVDHIAFDDMVDQASDALLTQAMVKPGESGALVTGIQKLAQRFLLELLTIRGTLKYLPTRGTTFMAEAQQGLWRTSSDVEQSFYGSLLEIENNLVSEEDVNDPPDEKFASAQLLSVTVATDQTSIRVQLTSQAGTSREIIYPIRINTI